MFPLTNTLAFTLSDASKAKIKSFIIDDYKTGKNILNCAELGSSKILQSEMIDRYRIKLKVSTRVNNYRGCSNEDLVQP